MNPIEVGFEPIPHDMTSELLIAGGLIGGSLLAIYLLGRFVLQRVRDTISWPLLRIYYGITTPVFLFLIGLASSPLPFPIAESILAILSFTIGLTHFPLIPFYGAAVLILPIDVSPWLIALFFIPSGYFLGRGFVFLLHWLAFSNEPSTLRLRQED